MTLRRRLVAAALAAGVLAAACAGGDAGPDVSAGGDAAPGPAPAAPAPEATSIPEPAPLDGAAPSVGEPGGEEPPPAPPGGESDSAAAGEGAAGAPSPAPAASDGSEPAAVPAAPAGEAEPPPGTYPDPRREALAEFQRGFDRTHPFQSLEAFCLPHGAPAAPPGATDEGIGAESITLVHLRTRIEEIVDLGFAAPVGDVTDMFDTYTRIVNERCGGVWGRRIDLQLVEVAALGVGGQDIDTLRNAACIEATERHGAVILMNTTSFQGTAMLCVTEEHDAALIGNQALPEEYVTRGGGRLMTIGTTLEGNLAALAEYLIAGGALAGRRVGIVAPNTPGEVEAVRAGLTETLEAAGVQVAVFDVIDCAGTSICIGGMTESVQRLRSEGVDVLFPTLNAISLPAYVTEMTAQGFGPGDVQFYNSDFNSQGNEVVAGLIVTFGGQAAGALYDGAVLLVHGDVGRYRLADYAGPPPFDEMCMAEYRENSVAGEDFDPRDPAESNKHGMVALVCGVYRVALRALYDAGANPTRADVFAAMERLGPVDLPAMLPASLAPGKPAMGDAFQPVTFRYPCPFAGLGTSVNICLVPGDYADLQLRRR